MIRIFILIILFFGSIQAEFKVTSWNLKNLSLNSLMFKKSIGQINQYIKSNNHFDVIALQELRDRQIVFFLSGGIKEIFFSDFKRLTSEYKGKGTHKEVYGFLVHDKYKDVRLVELGNYKDFKRPPSAVILDKKIAVVNIHIVYGKSKKARVAEVKKLKKITKELQNKYHIQEDNIIIVGDFNLEYKDMVKILKDKQVLVEGQTTLGKTKKSKNYDHCIVGAVQAKGIVRDDIINDLKFFTKNISDHLPIECTIDILY